MIIICPKSKLEKYYKIYEQIFTDNKISVYNLAKKTGMSRNTVSKYLREMYKKTIIRGPFLEMKSTETYREYIYLMNFHNPVQVFEGLKEFPHIVYHALTFGDWNTFLISNKLMDFSQLKGFENLVFKGIKYCCCTPKVCQTDWRESFSRIHEFIEHFPLQTPEPYYNPVPALYWKKDQWKLFSAFKDNTRKKVTPLLRKINVRYSTYTDWFKNLKKHCTAHTEFYPEGYNTYQHYWLLLPTKYKKSVSSLLSLFPTTTFFMEMGDSLGALVNVVHSSVIRNLICTLLDMETVKLIKGFKKAQIICEHYHKKLDEKE